MLPSNQLEGTHRKMTNEKSEQLGRDIQETLRDIAIEDCCAEAALLDHNLSNDANVSNEDRARLVCDCFCDYAEAIDLPRPFAAFSVHFPTLAELV